MSENNPYSAPDADLAIESSGPSVDAIKQFPHFTTWAVVGLSIITMGLYAYYWLYSRTKILNNLLPNNSVASWLPITTIILMVVNMILSYGPLLMGDSQLMATLSIPSMISGVAVFVLFLVWVFGFRNRMNGLVNKASGNDYASLSWLDGFLTFFINVYYFQYKINEMYDRDFLI